MNVNLSQLVYLAGVLITLPPNGFFEPNSFFRPKGISIIKTKSTTIAFSLLLLSFSSLFPFLLFFSLVTVILELLGLRNLPFDAFSLEWL